MRNVPSRLMTPIAALALAAWCGPALAALSNAQLPAFFQGSTPLTSGSWSSVSVGQDMELMVTSPGNPGSGTPTSADVVITDSVDLTAWTNCGFRWNATNVEYVATYHHQAVTGGARTVTVTQTNSTFAKANATVTTGFTGTATCDAALNQAGGSNTTAATATFSPAVTGQANEIAIYAVASGTFVPSAPTGYTVIQTSNPSSGYDIQATAGTSVAATVTFNASTTWDGLLNGIYDAVAAAPPNKMFLMQ